MTSGTVIIDTLPAPSLGSTKVPKFSGRPPVNGLAGYALHNLRGTIHISRAGPHSRNRREANIEHETTHQLTFQEIIQPHAFLLLFLREEESPYLPLDSQCKEGGWSDPAKEMGVKPLRSTKQENLTFCIDYRPFSWCWHIYELWVASLFFLLNWVRVGPPIQPKCRCGHCDWTAIYTIGNRFWEMKSVIRPLFHTTTTTKTEMGYNIGTWSKEVSKIKRQDCIHSVVKHLGASSMDKTIMAPLLIHYKVYKTTYWTQDHVRNRRSLWSTQWFCK